MKKKAMVLAALMSILAGCNGAGLDARFAQSANEFAVQIGGEYQAVLNGTLDPTTFTEQQRQTRLDRIAAQIALTESAVAASKR